MNSDGKDEVTNLRWETDLTLRPATVENGDGKWQSYKNVG